VTEGWDFVFSQSFINLFTLSVVAQKKKTLVVNPFDDLTLVALSTPLKDYKLAWHLNETLGLNFKKMTGFKADGNQPELYSFYYYDAGENMNVFNLIQLQNEGIKLIKLPLSVDFLFIIRNNISESKRDEWLSAIRKIPGMSLVVLLDIEKFKVLDPLLEKIELHEFNILREQNARK
jgi:hypothetical protein